MKQTSVVIIGGGATGIGILRDLSMRGVDAVLLEMGGLAHGTSSRFHGLLHSGARYAVGDPESARECIEENMIMRRIGKQCVEETEGFFAALPEDDPDFAARWVTACKAAGIAAEAVDPEEARRLEPRLSPHVREVYRVPDSCIDGFRLVWHNALSARRYGGEVLTYHEVTAIRTEQGRVIGVDAKNRVTGETVAIDCEYIVNAAGSWSGVVARMAGLDVSVSPDKGTLIVFNHRFTSRVVNRLHKSSDGDIFVPHGSVTIFGTTSTPSKDPADSLPTSEDVTRLLDIGEPLFPDLRSYRILRAFAGTRPLYTPNSAAGRAASRNFHIVDHMDEGLRGMASIFGGKLTTYRLMAERMSDLVCRRLGVTTPCRTAEEAIIPDPAPEVLERAARSFPVHGIRLVADRLGDAFGDMVKNAAREADNGMLCECEMVTAAEIEYVANDPATHSLHDVRLRTRLGMGTCQGTFCSLRAAAALAERHVNFALSPVRDVQNFLQERWRGLRPALWDTQLKESELNRAVYLATLNLDGACREQNN